MILETERLKIIPLSVNQLGLLIKGTDKIEIELGLEPSGVELEPHTLEAMKQLFHLAIKNTDKYLWFTNWQIILKSLNISIGSACFTGMPDEKGQVEVGYGINENFRNSGYMAEALSKMCNWALNQKNVKIIVAETEKENYASHKVLQKCGMKIYSTTNNSIWWKLLKS